VTELVVADAGPLIGMARVGLLFLLRDIFGKVLIPTRVLTELQVGSGLPGALALSEALRQGWLLERPMPLLQEPDYGLEILDPGEAAAILLARVLKASILIDERRGRSVAKDLGLVVIGTGAVLIEAKGKGLLDRVDAAIEQLSEAGYRLAPALRQQLLELAGEA
jgi:predicted nucleic acid-binding protein